MNKELTLKEAETIVDTMYQNRFVEAGVDEGNTIHLGNLNKLSFTDLESASILLLRTELRQKREITQLTNNWNELEDILKIKKARMLNEPDYSKYYLEGYETAIQTTHSSHSGIMLETAKNSIVVLCDELLDKMKEISGGK